jgi:hypothetical protein
MLKVVQRSTAMQSVFVMFVTLSSAGYSMSEMYFGASKKTDSAELIEYRHVE